MQIFYYYLPVITTGVDVRIALNLLNYWLYHALNCVLDSSIYYPNIDTTMHNFINLLTCAALHVTQGIPTYHLSAVLSF